MDIRLTITVGHVLRAFLADVSQPRYGYELMRSTGLESGRLYSVLTRLLEAGWLVRDVEDIDPILAGEPARRLYRLSPTGLEAARDVIVGLGDRSLPAPGRPIRPQPEMGLA